MSAPPSLTPSAPGLASLQGAVERAPNATYAFTTAFFEELCGAGVQHVCISPGSRSAPLTVAAARQTGLQCWVHIDERSAGFFALGLARSSRSPVALVCTSGTAAANYLPAIVEANHSRVPLVVLTADRPPELRDWDAGQTIDQLKLYGDHVRWFAELPVPGDDPERLRHARSLGCRAAAEAQGHAGRPGPVHLNWPFREPLDPLPGPRAEASSTAAPRSLSARHSLAVRPPSNPTSDMVDELAALSRAAVRGVIACGPLDEGPALSAAIVDLGRATGWPVLADSASNLRAGQSLGSETPVVACADLLLRSEAFADTHRPEVVVRFGSTPLSKAFRLWLEDAPPRELIVVDPHGGFSDPSHLASRVLAVDPEALCRAWQRACGGVRDPDWLAAWRTADDRAARAIEQVLEADPRLSDPGRRDPGAQDSRLHEAHAVRELCDALPDGSMLYVSNSMPIRYLDACMPLSERRLRVLSNRGANGIDGMISSAFGAAAAGHGKSVLLTGDLAFVHDVGGLLAGRHYKLPMTIVVLDNDGGGIFSYLPIAAHGETVDFEANFRTPHGLDFEHAAHLFGAAYHRVSTLEHFRATISAALDSEGVSIVHIPTDRDASIDQFRAIAAAVARSTEESSA